MISVKVKITDGVVKNFLVKIEGAIAHPSELNHALAIRMRRELKAHFAEKNLEPNKMNAPKTNFWREISDATDILEGSVTDKGATVQVGDQRFNIQLFGGTIVPKVAKSLTIPLIVEARGESVASYRRKTGNRLFTIPGRDVLFEKAEGDRATESRVGFTRGRDRSFGVKLGARQPLRAVFALKKSVTIAADAKALPEADFLAAALQEEADDFMSDLQKGILA